MPFHSMTTILSHLLSERNRAVISNYSATERSSTKISISYNVGKRASLNFFDDARHE